MENDEVKDYELDEDALEEGDGYRVKLDSFEGPLDLLLHLIKRSKIRICDIFVSDITGQFLEFIERDIDDVDLDKASEFLGMAAYLLEIKAKSLLPKPETAQAGEQEDDGSELMRRLEEYELYKAETEKLNNATRGEVYLYPPNSDYGHYQYEGVLYVDPVYKKGAFYSTKYGYWSRPGVRKEKSNRPLFYSRDTAEAHWDEVAYTNHKKDWVKAAKRGYRRNA